jgi:hypothetical protein
LDYPNKTLYVLLSSKACFKPCQSHLPCSHHSNNTWLEEHLIKINTIFLTLLLFHSCSQTY